MFKQIKEGTRINVALQNGTNFMLIVIKINSIQGFIQGVTDDGHMIIINIKKIESISFPSIPLPIPTYREIVFAVPQPLGVTGLPSNIYFQIHKNFTAAQVQKIRDAINGTLFQWFTHMNEKWDGGANNGVSQLASCTNTYATKNFRPFWYRGLPISNGRTATNIAMDQFVQLIKDNGFKRSSPAKIDPRTLNTIHAATATTQTRVPLSFQINPKQLDRIDITTTMLTGSMFHAWLHRAGFIDPKTTSYFISEAPMCIMRGYQAKIPVIPDSAFYQFFD